MHLLVLKVSDKYIRLLERGYELTGLDKASVFPEKDMEMVRKRYLEIKDDFPELTIRKLTIKEEPL